MLLDVSFLLSNVRCLLLLFGVCCFVGVAGGWPASLFVVVGGVCLFGVCWMLLFVVRSVLLGGCCSLLAGCCCRCG